MNPLLALLLRPPLFVLGTLVLPLPRSWEVPLGRALGRLLLRLDPKRRRIAEENLRLCLPELSPEERARLLRANYEHYGLLALEIAHYFSPWPGHWRRYARGLARLEGLEHWQAALSKGKGVLFATAHLANWEVMGALSAETGRPILAVTRRLKPAWLHRRLEAARLSLGVRCAYQPRTLPDILRALRAGQSVGFAMDQYMPPPMGERLRFFGAEVDTLAALAPLARRTGAAVLPLRQERLPDGRVLVAVEPELTLGADDTQDNQRLSDRVEAWVRARPQEWLWVHRRFKHAVWPPR